MGGSERGSGRAYGLTLLVLAAGAVTVLVAYGLTWAVARVPMIAGADDASRELALSGRDLLPWAAATGWVALAGLAGLVATRSWGRRAVGLIVILAGLGASAGALWFAVASPTLVSDAVAVQADASAINAADASGAWLIALVGGLAVVVAGLLAVLRGHRWPTMGSRYERNGPAPTTRSAWDLQDMGQDPTEDLVE
jgi:uncharacterized membrane protein (TIGR02234 family)